MLFRSIRRLVYPPDHRSIILHFEPLIKYFKINITSRWPYIFFGRRQSLVLIICYGCGLYCNFEDYIVRGCPRSSGGARISSPSTTYRCPYHASDRPFSTHHPVFFSIDLRLNVSYITLRLLVAVPEEEVSKKTGHHKTLHPPSVL